MGLCSSIILHKNPSVSFDLKNLKRRQFQERDSRVKSLAKPPSILLEKHQSHVIVKLQISGKGRREDRSWTTFWITLLTSLDNYSYLLGCYKCNLGSVHCCFRFQGTEDRERKPWNEYISSPSKVNKARRLDYIQILLNLSSFAPTLQTS